MECSRLLFSAQIRKAMRPQWMSTGAAMVDIICAAVYIAIIIILHIGMNHGQHTR